MLVFLSTSSRSSMSLIASSFPKRKFKFILRRTPNYSKNHAKARHVILIIGLCNVISTYSLWLFSACPSLRKPKLFYGFIKSVCQSNQTHSLNSLVNIGEPENVICLQVLMDSTRSGKYPGARPLVTSQNPDSYFHCGMLTWNTLVLHYRSVTVAWTSLSHIA